MGHLWGCWFGHPWTETGWGRSGFLLLLHLPASTHVYYHTSTTTYFWRLSGRLLNLAESNWLTINHSRDSLSSLPLGPSSWEPLSTIYGPACYKLWFHDIVHFQYHFINVCNLYQNLFFCNKPWGEFAELVHIVNLLQQDSPLSKD